LRSAETGGGLVLIDYEYSRFDYRAFDLGNLACEFTFFYGVAERPGYTFDASKYPGDEKMGAFFVAYADAYSRSGASRPTVQELAAETRCGIFASHLFWALWSILMGAGQLDIAWRPQEASTPVEGTQAPDIAVLDDAIRSDGSSSGGISESSVAAGHSVFDYVHYGFTRAREFLRLKSEAEAVMAKVAAECASSPT
jgi:hypothetical protein